MSCERCKHCHSDEPTFLTVGPKEKSWTERELDDAFYYNGHMQHSIIYWMLKEVLKGQRADKE